MMSSGFGIPGLGMIFIWGLLILGIVWLVRIFTGIGGSGAGRERSAREILDERFARGEIDEQEYQRKKKMLM